MKKYFKALLSVLLMMTLSLSLTSCDDNKEKSDHNDSTEETKKEDKKNNEDTKKQGNNSDALAVGEYKVEKSENTIIVTINDGSAISTTTYTFTNGAMSGAVVVQKCSTESIAQYNYDVMVNEPTITNIYTDISISGDTITLVMNNDALIAYTNMSLDQVYDLMCQTYTPTME